MHCYILIDRVIRILFLPIDQNGKFLTYFVRNWTKSESELSRNSSSHVSHWYFCQDSFFIFIFSRFLSLSYRRNCCACFKLPFCCKLLKLAIFNELVSSFQNPNVYKHYKRLTRWKGNRCYSLKTTYLIFETFQILFTTASLISTELWSCFMKWYEKERSIKLRPLRIHNGGCF